MDGGFRNNIGVQAIAEINRIDIVTVEQFISTVMRAGRWLPLMERSLTILDRCT